MAPAECNNCHRSTDIACPQSVNAVQNPDLKARVKDGSLFVWECPYCGRHNLAKYPLLYHDPQQKLMVWLLPDGNPLPQAALEAARALEGYTLRRVREVGELIEKVNLFDAGLDDRVLEMCKWVTCRELSAKNPAVQDAPLKFMRLEGADHDLVLAFPLDGQMQVVNVGFNVYEDARGILARNPSIQTAEGFAEVNAAWIAQFFR